MRVPPISVHGVEKGEALFQVWLRGELRDLAGDLRLGLRHDLQTPLDVLQAVERLIEDRT